MNWFLFFTLYIYWILFYFISHYKIKTRKCLADVHNTPLIYFICYSSRLCLFFLLIYITGAFPPFTLRLCRCCQLTSASAVCSSFLTFHEGVTNNRQLPMSDSCLWLMCSFITWFSTRLYLKCKALIQDGMIFFAWTQTLINLVHGSRESAAEWSRGQSVLYYPGFWDTEHIFFTQLPVALFRNAKALWF